MMTMTMPQMGIGILFHVTENHVGAHLDERRIRVEDLDDSVSASPVDIPEMPAMTEEELNAELALPLSPSPSPSPLDPAVGEEESVPEKTEEVQGEKLSAAERALLEEDHCSLDPPLEAREKEEEEEEFDEEEVLTDEELIRIALEEPERADVARRRLERKAKRNRPKVQKVIEPEVKQVMESEGIAVDFDIEGINALTGVPRADDEFYAAYAMVAPLSALLNFKYKIKFGPGETKKGKAWPMMREYFTSVKGVPAEQTALIKLVPENDVINLLPFNLKLVLGAGGTNLQKKKQQGKKGKKKGKK
jgi:hypothetical protein